MANFNSRRWSKEETRTLELNLDKYNWDFTKLPITLLAEKLNRTESAILAKAARLKNDYNRTYEWSEEEQNGAFFYYLKGLPLKEIHDKLINFGSQATLEQLESELKRIRKSHEEEAKAYAEERGLKIAKHLTLETLEFFLKNRNTTSDFTRKALHSRIANG